MEDYKLNSSMKNMEGLGFFIFKIIEFILMRGNGRYILWKLFSLLGRFLN